MRVEMVVLIRLDAEDRLRFADLTELDLSAGPAGEAYVEHRLPARSAEYLHFLDELDQRGIEYWVREERHFDLREIRDARALRLRPLDTIHHVGLPHETLLDWSDCCATCMRVPTQRGQLLVDGRLLADHCLLGGPRGELLVSERIALRMIKEGVTGCLLRELRLAEDGPEPAEGWFQVLTTTRLPPAVSPPTRFALTEDHCASCGQGGLFVDSMLYYDVDDGDLDDINATFELIGEGAGLAPELIFSPRFYNLLVSAGARFEEPEPVVFV
ncbi:MAG: hypothetical protein H6807_02975 [Planctomycetes bacterium]|nr:hypothetical protein [Planctomycetota bacterium]